ncbi:MAG TPA: methyltransferase, partial [Arenibaculum sp.]|nr:methyltransferase [Arenibaculum sp.]
MFDDNPVRGLDTDGLIRLRDSAFATDMFIAAVTWLDLFTKLAERPRTLGEICRDLEIVERPATTMMHLMHSWGLVVTRDGRYEPTEVAHRHLVAGAAQSLIPYFASLKERATVREMVDVLRLSTNAVWRERKEQEKAKWSELMQRPDFADFYTAGMDSRGSVLGPGLADTIDVSGRRHLLDVAGGSGIYVANVVKRNPHLKAAVLERPPVDDVARKMLERQGLGGR